MDGKIKDLSRYSRVDAQKQALIDEVLEEFPFRVEALLKQNYNAYKRVELDFQTVDAEICGDVCEDICDEPYEEPDDELEIGDSEGRAVLRAPKLDFGEPTKYCPKCGQTYSDYDFVCLRCAVRLKSLSEKLDVSEIESHPKFMVNGENDFTTLEELLSEANLAKVRDFDFTYGDYEGILYEIRSQAFRNFDALVKENEIDFDARDILEKMIVFAKSFVRVSYKSYGGQLGYFEKDTISIDDRQSKALQITTLIHELSHFLIQEILIHVLCRILDASRSPLIESVVAFVLSYIPFTQLIDEYAAHNVEGRFTLFGFQDYSSFIQIERSMEGEMSREEIEITKSIGNNFAVSIKDILEAFIDRPLREDIKVQFRKDVLDRPNYDFLEMENCQILNEEGFLKAIWLILNDGCIDASLNIERLESIIDQ